MKCPTLTRKTIQVTRNENRSFHVFWWKLQYSEHFNFSDFFLLHVSKFYCSHRLGIGSKMHLSCVLEDWRDMLPGTILLLSREEKNPMASMLKKKSILGPTHRLKVHGGIRGQVLLSEASLGSICVLLNRWTNKH